MQLFFDHELTHIATHLVPVLLLLLLLLVATSSTKPNGGDTRSRNFYQKLAHNKTQL